MPLSKSPRYAIQQLDDKIQITLPSQKTFPQLLNFSALLIMGLFVTGQIIYALVESFQYNNDSKVIIFEIVMFIVLLVLLGADGFAIYSFLWTIFGKEVITANPLITSLSRQIFGWKKVATFSSKDVSNLHANTSYEKAALGSVQYTQYALGNNGAIAFEYGAKTIHFGVDVDKIEVEKVVSILQQHLSQSKTG